MKIEAERQNGFLRLAIPPVLLDQAGIDRTAGFVDVVSEKGRLIVSPVKSAPVDLDDPLFGRLIADSWGWMGTISLPPLGARLPLHILQDGRNDERLPGPSDRQRKALREFRKSLKACLKRVDEANLAYYEQYRNENLDETDPESRRLLPVVRLVDGLRKLLRRPSIRIPFQPNRQWAVEIVWDCRWDPEHGHRAELWNGKVKNVGSDAAF